MLEILYKALKSIGRIFSIFLESLTILIEGRLIIYRSIEGIISIIGLKGSIIARSNSTLLVGTRKTIATKV